MPAAIGMVARRSADCSQRGREAVALAAEDEGDLVEAADRVLELDARRGRG